MENSQSKKGQQYSAYSEETELLQTYTGVEKTDTVSERKNRMTEFSKKLREIIEKRDYVPWSIARAF